MASARLRTLLLTQNGTGAEVVWADTLLRGLLRLPAGTPCPRPLRRIAPVRVLFSLLKDHYRALSYTIDWRDALVASPRLAVEECNINDRIRYHRCMRRIREYDLVIVAHSAAGDDMTLLNRAVEPLSRRSGPLAVFIGNEYDLLGEKIAFLRATAAQIVGSQLPLAAARYLYGDCGPTRVVSMPHALNPALYSPGPDGGRDIDIGFIGDLYWPFIGDDLRTRMVRGFQAEGPAHGLVCDIRTERIDREQWAAFLRRCRAIIGAESGTYYLNDRGALLTKARDYNLHENRDATLQEVFDRFYRGVTPGVSGKAISSRHFEPIGTRTCQILMEGEYNGILRADEHFIPVRLDMADMAEAIGKFRDETFRLGVVQRAYDHVMSAHTYAHRVQALLQELGL
ncbi:MAG: glycosyltransferase [Gammaproteobacteria bacterium]